MAAPTSAIQFVTVSQFLLLTMESEMESLWVFALATKFDSFSSQAFLFLLLFALIAWIFMAVFFWLFPGGTAWGRYYWRKRKSSSSVIPGPRGVPLFGSMNLMANLAHRNLAHMAMRYGAKRLMAFSLGETRVVVTSDPSVAKEILNSTDFADRPVKESAYNLMFDRAMGFAPYGVYWRNLRRIASTHLFCPKQIQSSEPQRQEIAANMAEMIRYRPGEFRVRDVLKQASLCNMMWSVFGRGFELGVLDEEEKEMRALVEEGYELLGMFNWSDHLPWLAAFDFQKIRFRCSKLVPKVNSFVGSIIQEHRFRTGDRNYDFVDVLLSLQGPDKLSDNDMVAVLWEMIFRGTDTVAVLIEWILARLVLHLDVQSRVHEELDRVIEKSRPLAESDVQSLTYLSAVVKEVLRLHPPGPLLSWARLAIRDTTVEKYQVPEGTTTMVNMWAISRDPQVWPDPLKFSPERFMYEEGSDREFSVLGSDLRLAPFGSGRRVCPGKTLGLTTVTYWLAYLLHEFEWVEGENRVNLSERLKLSCEMANPLTIKVKCRRR